MFLKQFPDPLQFKQLSRQYNVVPVYAEILADMETPVSVFKKLYRDQGPAFLFESAEGGEKWGRFSFISASSFCDIRIFKEFVEIRKNGTTRQIPHQGNPLSVLKDIMGRYKRPAMPDLPRFWGGLAGYITYEMVSFFEAIPNTVPEDTPLAHFIIPDVLLVFDNIRHTLLVIAIAFLEDHPVAGRAYQEATGRIRNLIGIIKQPLPDQSVAEGPKHFQLKADLEPEQFRKQVTTVKDHIRAGDVIQTVISQSFSCNELPDLFELYRAQRYINPSPYLYLMHLGDIALAGSSPETMVRLENSVATLRPIAGTRPRGKTEKEDRRLADELLRDEKERAEHLMLVDLGRNDLGRIAETGTVQVSDLMVVERYSHVMHLVSNINCHLKPEYDAWDLLRAVFPAGTLSGAPKVRAMEMIAELEQDVRGPYGGAVGYISFDGNMDMAITIRTACIRNNRLTVRAGAGIVADSDPETERIETVNKARAIEKALELMQQKIR
ncbi:MAG: anthranilate synthase component I family protein [Desulfobacterales bacterium]|nr:anthranilate synthase component I family protein [Desulfobacterales bacterium]MDD4392552.1 anthranilate synthase component I family protein [Desulfobacterales bacterium]